MSDIAAGPAKKQRLFLVKQTVPGVAPTYLVCQVVGELKPDDDLIKTGEVENYLYGPHGKLVAAPLPQLNMDYAWMGPSRFD